MRLMVARTMSGTCTYVDVVISPATHARPVVTSVSQATRAVGSSTRIASRTASEMASATLSGCPSVTDSDVKRWRSYTKTGLGSRDAFQSRRSAPATATLDGESGAEKRADAKHSRESLAQLGFGVGGCGSGQRGVGGFFGHRNGDA